MPADAVEELKSTFFRQKRILMLNNKYLYDELIGSKSFFLRNSFVAKLVINIFSVSIGNSVFERAVQDDPFLLVLQGAG